MDHAVRTCKTCNEEQPIERFRLRYDGTANRRLTCKTCQNRAHRKMYKKHKRSPSYKHHCNRKKRTSLRSWLAFLMQQQRRRDRLAGNPGFNIDTDYLVSLYEKQGGKCAISGMQMLTALNDLRSISMDRIHRDKEHVIGNVQLVCIWVNFAKNKHPDHHIREVLAEFKQLAVDEFITG